MAIENNNYCVILAGGKGRRLWPCSRESFPKQFIDFFGVGRTQLQQTFDRFAKIVPKENIFISTNREYTHLVKEQLPEVAVDNILAEPIHRNTAPSVAWACFRISRLCKEANLIVSPSDQAVFDEEAFDANILEGFRFVSKHEGLLTLGVKPTRPEPGYGYIQLGDETEIRDLFRVQSFTEKPERDFARMFMESGEFYWNTGVFLCNVDYMLESLKKILPMVVGKIYNNGTHLSIEEEQAFINENFPHYPNLSVDYGILEKSENVYVMRCDFGWADLGTWHSAYEAMSRTEGDNVVIDSEVILEESHNNIIKIPKDHLAVINGLDGYIVAEKGNVLFICKKEDSSALVRKYVNEVKLKYGDEFV
ncbi:MAG: mannose-1-phosphate guanylyltransferase [Prevotella sp.]|nr:mannose-1-phosphate guanylyltransferase [Prevotella sp.]